MSSDGGLWPDGFKKYLCKPRFQVDWQRIESAMTGGGIPDLNGCMDGVECWVELKFTDAWSVGIRPDQVGWGERRIRAGGRVYLATRRRHSGGPRKGPPVDELWIHHGRNMRHILDRGLQVGPPPLLKCSGGPGNWLWPVVAEILFG